MKKTLYYSIENGGDGSAYPVWFDTEALASWHQEHMDEGWGEPCNDSISVESNGDMFCDELQTAEKYYLELISEYYGDAIEEDSDIKSYVEEFFPDGIPFFIVSVLDDKKYEVILNGKTIDTMYGHVGPMEERGYGHDPTIMQHTLGTSEYDCNVQQDIINDTSLKLSKIKSC